MIESLSNIKADNKRCDNLSLVVHLCTVRVATILVSPHLDFLLSFLSWLNFCITFITDEIFNKQSVRC